MIEPWGNRFSQGNLLPDLSKSALVASGSDDTLSPSKPCPSFPWWGRGSSTTEGHEEFELQKTMKSLSYFNSSTQQVT